MAYCGIISTQAQNVIDKLGGVGATAQLAGRHQSRVRRWTYSKERGGTGGLIPADVQQDLMEAARQQKIALTPEDFFPEKEEDAATP